MRALNNNTTKIYDYLVLLAMIYLAVDLSSMVFSYKIIKLGSIIAAASSLIFPLTYSIMDIIAEVYGYKIAKKIILYGIICDLIFAIFTLFVSHIPSLSSVQTTAYILVVGSLLRIVFAQTVGVLLGAFVNIYFVTKWRVMTHGRYFWLRSIGSSTIGEAVMLVISVFIALSGIISYSDLVRLIVFTYLYKVIFAILISPFVNIIAIFLKNKMEYQGVENSFNQLDIWGISGFSPNFQKQ